MEAVVGAMPELTEKDRSALLRTTARKTMAVRVGAADGQEGLSFIVVHCKEPKNANAAKAGGLHRPISITFRPDPSKLSSQTRADLHQPP